ncbi:MAG: cyclopropane-fatty-acyl-phospholipid synthase family protein [Beijerinckiaceae bacterium]|nr:cyclopropane-fatty-acyl-phospholipid synthase family protein [Beijerinckiaceae bacterium]
MRLLPRLFKKIIRRGRLNIIGPDGRRYQAGPGDGPQVTIRILDPRLDWKIALDPELNAAEAYMDGTLQVEGGTIHDLMVLIFRNKREFDMQPGQIFWNGIARGLRRAMQHNPISRALANTRAHYDIGNDLFSLFLDKDLQYSCGYFPTGDESLEDAQTKKKRHIAAKLFLQPEQSVLDIGCGWGGLALYLASVADVRVVGITLSEEQHRVAQARAKEAGLAHLVEFRLADYRTISQKFDRIVSVGMLEHVGVTHLREYFLAVRNLLAANGVALVHSISTKSPPGITSSFLRKHIFPGGYAPSLSETFAEIERTGLWATDVEIWRVHYARTLEEWRRRFICARDDGRLPAAYDERFQRMWEFYLSACQCVFEYGSSHVFQIQLARQRDGVPLHRDYIAETERLYAERDADIVERLFIKYPPS